MLTSSIAAIIGDAESVLHIPGQVVNEDASNASSSLIRDACGYSRTLAENEARRIARAQDRRRLMAVYPGLVIGPVSSTHPTSESSTITSREALGVRCRPARLPTEEVFDRLVESRVPG